jgi:2,3-bisphosphoglycerate-dependent phosphoglycerate mutase
MTTRLIIARHGNTFTKEQTPTRVGGRTDLPLVASGLEQGKKLGLYLKNNDLLPDVVFASKLKRTQQTAEQALSAMQLNINIIPDQRFNEIDYGPDENKIEDKVIARIGKQAIELWDKEAIVPQGWLVDPQQLIEQWLTFAETCVDHHKNQNILVVTSNGIARFAPYLTGDFAAFREKHNIKISTGALCILENEGDGWVVESWNIIP